MAWKALRHRQPQFTPLPHFPQMGFFAYSAWDNSTRMHYTLAARQDGAVAKNQLFSLQIALNGTAGTLIGESSFVDFPAPLTQADITYLFTDGGLVFIAFAQAVLLTVSPATGAVLNVTSLLPPADGNPVDGLASAFDDRTGTFYVNAVGTGGLYLHSFNVKSRTTSLVGPLPPAPGTAGQGGERVDQAVASMAVYPPNCDGWRCARASRRRSYSWRSSTPSRARASRSHSTRSGIRCGWRGDAGRDRLCGGGRTRECAACWVAPHVSPTSLPRSPPSHPLPVRFLA